MPITLRNVRPDLGVKLRELEADADALHRVASALVPASPRRRSFARTLSRLSLTAWMHLRPAYLLARSSLGACERALGDHRLATALRFVHAWSREAVWYLSLAFGVLLALALAIILVAPPD